MISVESLLCRELYDGCYVVFMTFVIRSHDRHCNYDVLCRSLALLEIIAKLSSSFKFSTAVLNTIHDSIK